MFDLSARPWHVWFVAVALSVHLGVYCLVHTGSPAERGPLPVATKKERIVRFALPEACTKKRTIYVGIQSLYRGLIYASLLCDRGTTTAAVPRYEE